MALLRPALLLAVLLTPVCGRRPPDQDPPIKSLRMDPERKRLTWELHGNVSEVTCSINAKAFTKVRNKTYCSFLNLPCQVTNYSIQVTKGQPFSAWILYPEEGGTPRAAAENLTCWVHDTDFLTCSWAVGREAPGDVQYHLYLENPESHRQWPCARYRRDARGTNVQCRFDDFYVFSRTQTRFLVKGTSNSSHVPCLETMDRLAKLEVLAAPNVTSRWCNHTHSFMQWWVRSHLNNDFKYELQIQKGTNLAYTQETQESFLELRNPGTYTAKVRAMDATFSYQPWGPWSVPQHFVCAGERARLPVWLGALLVALGTLLALGLLFLLCARFSVRQKLFPRIPHMRPPTSDNLQNGSMIAWDPDQDSQEECPVAEVQVLGER